MSSLTHFVNTPQAEAQNRPLSEICALGHPLGDCPARRVGCRNHFELLNLMYPPLTVLYHVRATMHGDPAVRRWLDNLDSILPGPRTQRQGGR